MKCRFCGNEIKDVMLDLVNAPPSNAYLKKEQLNELEKFYPLKVMVCPHCWLVQIDEYASCADIFNDDYLYFSSYSSSWVEHARKYVDMIVHNLAITKNSLGWNQRWNIAKTIKKTADWYKNYYAGADARELSLADITEYMKWK